MISGTLFVAADSGDRFEGGQLQALLAVLVAPLDQARASGDRFSGDVREVAFARHLRVEDDVEAAQFRSHWTALGGRLLFALFGRGLVEGAPALGFLARRRLDEKGERIAEARANRRAENEPPTLLNHRQPRISHRFGDLSNRKP